MVRESPLNEIILRKYERPYITDRRQLIKKICLSLGLLQPGDSRDVIVDILLVLTDSQKNKEKLDSVEIGKRVEELRKKNNLPLKGLAESNVRRQLKRLRDLMIIEKNSNFYYLNEFEPLNKIFEDKIEQFIINPSVSRIKEYLNHLAKE